MPGKNVVLNCPIGLKRLASIIVVFAINFSLRSKDDADAIYVDDDTRIQVLESMSWLPRADKEQCGAFIVRSLVRLSTPTNNILQRDERVLVVWAYNLDDVIPTCRDFEDKLIKLVWSRRATLVPSSVPPPAPSLSAFSSPDRSKEDVNEKTGESSSQANLNSSTSDDNSAEKIDEKELQAIVERNQASSKRAGKKDRTCKLGLGYFVSNKPQTSSPTSNLEAGEKRPMRMLAPIYCGLAAGLSFCK